MFKESLIGLCSSPTFIPAFEVELAVIIEPTLEKKKRTSLKVDPCSSFDLAAR